jgi:hypothetical protein
MIIDDLNIIGMAAFEVKAHAPLIVDADAPLPDSVTLQLLQPVIVKSGDSLLNSRHLFFSQ